MNQVIFTIIAALLVFTGLANAQKESDFIITNSHDTLYGEVFRPVNFMKRVQFRPNDSNDFKTFSADELYGYRYQNEFFKSCEIQSLEDGLNKMFLLSFLQGTVSLYNTKGGAGLYIEKDGKFYLLERKDKLIDGKWIEDRRFTGILKVLFSDCGDFPDKAFEKVKLNAGSISEITQLYNECRDPLLKKTDRKSNPILFVPGIQAGVSLDRAHLSHSIFDEMPSGGISTGYTFGGNVSIESAMLSNVFFKFGLYFSKKQGSSGLVSLSLEDISVEYSASYIQPLIQVGYSFPGKKFLPFLSGGFTYLSPLSNQKTEVKINRITGSINKESFVLPYLSANGYSLILAAGIEFKRLAKFRPSIEYQFEGNKNEFKTHRIILGTKF